MSGRVESGAFAVVEQGRFVRGRQAETVMPWWSFTKTAIAAAALCLVRDGKLSLDDPISGRNYTLRHLLQHRAGLPDYGGIPAYHEAVARGGDPWPEAFLLEQADADRPRFEAGDGWEYSNIGYLFAVRLVEEASGVGFPEALAELVLGPLGIEGARVASDRADLAGVDLGSVSDYHPGWVYHRLLVGPLHEAALLLDRLMTGDLLPPDLREEMRKAHWLDPSVAGRQWQTVGYGLGLMIGKTAFGHMVRGHTGGGPGSVCAVYNFPDSGRTVAAFAAGNDAAHVETAAFQEGGRETSSMTAVRL